MRKTNWRSTHKRRKPCLQAGDAKVAWADKTDLRRDLHVAERKLSTVGTTPHETSTTKRTGRTQNVVLPVHIPQQNGGSAGNSSLAKHDVKSTGMAPNKKVPSAQPDEGRGDLQVGARKEGLMQGPQGETHERILFLQQTRNLCVLEQPAGSRFVS